MKSRLEALNEALSKSDWEGAMDAMRSLNDYRVSLGIVGNTLKTLHETASKSLIEDTLDDSAKGHRIGTIEVCESMLLLFKDF